jgi:hypothetical protein
MGGEDVAVVTKLSTREYLWDPADPHRQDLVRAERRSVAATPTWGPLTADQLTALAALDDPGQELLTLARRSGVSLQDERDHRPIMRQTDSHFCGKMTAILAAN